MLENYIKLLPGFSGEKMGTSKEHVSVFQDFTNNFMMEDNHIFMRIFLQSADGYV